MRPLKQHAEGVSHTVVKIGIIGGSGLDDPKILKDAYEITVDTPFGAP